MADSLQLRRFCGTPEQVNALRDLSREWSVGPTGFWAFDDVLEALRRPTTLLLFAAADAAAPSWTAAAFVDVGPYAADLLYLYVRPEARRRKLGERLLTAVIEQLRARPAVDELFLEVRAGNESAIALYERLGMRRVGMRKSYYRNGDDAVVYRLQLAATAVPSGAP